MSPPQSPPGPEGDGPDPPLHICPKSNADWGKPCCRPACSHRLPWPALPPPKPWAAVAAPQYRMRHLYKPTLRPCRPTNRRLPWLHSPGAGLGRALSAVQWGSRQGGFPKAGAVGAPLRASCVPPTPRRPHVSAIRSSLPRPVLPPVCCVMAAGHGSLIRCVHLPWCTRAVGPSEGPVAQRPQQTRDSFECSSDKR